MVSSASSTRLTAVVPADAITGNVGVATSMGASNGLGFTVTVLPHLASLSTPHGNVGSTVLLTGSGFTTATGSCTFNGTVGSISSWSDTSIQVVVPAGATTGNVVVMTQVGASNGLPFTVTVPPVLTSLSPAYGLVGSTVLLTGSGFTATAGSCTFNGTVASISSWSDTSIQVVVPAGATTGNVVVTTPGGASSGLNFTVNTLSFTGSATGSF